MPLEGPLHPPPEGTVSAHAHRGLLEGPTHTWSQGWREGVLDLGRD